MQLYMIFPNASAKPSYTFGPRIKVFNVGGHKIGEVGARLSLGFLDYGFAHVSVTFDESDLRIMDQAFETRHGTAHSTREVAMQNRAGATFMNTVKTWSGPTLSIRLEHYSTKITEGNAMIGKRAYLDEFLRFQKEKGRDAAKGL
jgi:hypothetical protein